MGSDPYFCCSGCEVVYHALHDAGYGDTFYSLTDIAQERQPTPASTSVDPLLLSEFDSDAFLDEHTTRNDDGTRSVELFLDGVHCAACVWLVERLPQEMSGVQTATLDLPRARLSIRWTPEALRLSDVAEWLAQFGYSAHPVRKDAATSRTEGERKLLVKVGVSWALAGNVMLLAFALYAGLSVGEDAGLATAARWLSMILATVSVAYGGRTFITRAWSSLKLAVRTRRLQSLHMDLPIAAGILVGYTDSTLSTLTGTGEVWFDSITVLIAALLTARWLQLRSRRLAGDATDRLLSLIPSMVRRVTPSGDVETIPVEDLHIGNVVRIPTGEVIPVDGIVATGTSTVNNAVLTGESRPESVQPGSDVTAGATNLSAPLDVLVEASGTDTRVGSLLAWVRDGSDTDARVVTIADRLTGYFVSGVAVLALATALLWLWLDPSTMAQHVVALLVITCPCALGMATPLAMAVAAGNAARAGIFIKSEAATQVLTDVDAVVLDKTGTLTEGRLSLVRRTGSDAAIAWAASLETHSTHPVAEALVREAGLCSTDGTPPHTITNVDAEGGHGLRGCVDGHTVVVGRPDWVQSQCAQAATAFDDALTSFAHDGHTPVAVAVDGRMAAALAFGDRIRPDSRALIQRLRDDGKAVYLLSGDHPTVADAVARQLDLAPDHAQGHVAPEAKQAFVDRLQREGRTVVMIGDGVNDAAALQTADVGVAVEGGSTASLVAADVFLTRDGLRPVADLFDGAHHVMRVIRRNLGFSLSYNLLGALAAMSGWVGPLVAAIAMPISSLVVVTASILQGSFRTSGHRPAEAADPQTGADAPGGDSAPRAVHRPAAPRRPGARRPDPQPSPA